MAAARAPPWLDLRATSDPAADIPVINVGIALLPDADTPMVGSVVAGAGNSNSFTAEDLHNTFNHREWRHVSRVGTSSADAPPQWSTLRPPATCESCLRANCQRIHPTGHAGTRHDADVTVACDGWSVSVGHVHGGQRQEYEDLALRLPALPSHPTAWRGAIIIAPLAGLTMAGCGCSRSPTLWCARWDVDESIQN
ncbi:hypothetical protein AB1Y20_015498 [Prymnesium parvum]|uniref:Uncharacterized protein n=1 Tax=Prymnesium parvum TaxID=97485 RepID=A0AB34JYJ8_PRYPA